MRTSFVDANTLLEEAYFAEGRDVLDGRADLDAVKTAQVREGAELVARVADEDRLPTDPDGRYELLGMVGYVLGACRRHEVDLVDTVGSTLAKRVWTTASRLGSSLGVAPRFVFAHQALFNTARRDSGPSPRSPTRRRSCAATGWRCSHTGARPTRCGRSPPWASPTRWRRTCSRTPTPPWATC